LKYRKARNAETKRKKELEQKRLLSKKLKDAEEGATNVVFTTEGN